MKIKSDSNLEKLVENHGIGNAYPICFIKGNQNFQSILSFNLSIFHKSEV
ncbi:hypothetical protein L8106_17217 [Lyngbya sp. PCC 8106]|nr:hypothetical protein L8106_17217 [Lyngbya sp. PCC 8106]